VVAAVAARLGPHASAGLTGEDFERLRCDAWPSPIKRASGPLRIGAGLIADGLQLGHTLLEHRIGHVSDAVFDRVVESLEFGFRFGRTLAQFGDVSCPALSTLLAADEHTRQNLLETFRLQEALLYVLGYDAIELTGKTRVIIGEDRALFSVATVG
jgi:hypothetical protein